MFERKKDYPGSVCKVGREEEIGEGSNCFTSREGTSCVTLARLKSEGGSKHHGCDCTAPHASFSLPTTFRFLPRLLTCSFVSLREAVEALPT